MTTYTFPGSDLDLPQKLLGLLGSFWSETYQGSELVKSLLHARAQLAKQGHQDLVDLVDSTSRFDVPALHRENWTKLRLLKSETNNFDALVVEYGDGRTYGDGLAYGDIPLRPTYAYPIATNLVDCCVLMNRVTDPSVTWVKGLDFWFPETGVIAFRENPFENVLLPATKLLEGGEETDEAIDLWLFRGTWDWETLYEQFGYALKLKLESGENYKTLLNALLDSLILGTSARDLHHAWSAIADVPLVRTDGETVEAVLTDKRHEVIVTDQEAYLFPLGSTPVVSVGDVLQGGDPLVDTLRFHEFGRGIVPDSLKGLALGEGFRVHGFLDDIVFENKEVLLVVETDVNGYTKVSFELGGFPGDVELFWNTVHARGIAAGQTLAHLLDVRGDDRPSGVEPSIASLPATVNPLEFLVENLFRFHTYVVEVRPTHLGPNNLGLHVGQQLRKIVPPHTAMLVVVELEHSDEPITMNGPGSAEGTGYEEQVSGFPMMVASEMLGPAFVEERVRLYAISGKCE